MIQNLLKSYDIRAEAEVLLHGGITAVAPAIMRYFREVENAKRLLIGSDMRASSPRIVEMVTEFARQAGLDVILLQEKNRCFVSTPFLYYVAALPQYHDCGTIMVTASHNPAHDNGMKMTGKKLSPIAEGSGLEIVRQFALHGGHAMPADACKPGSISYTFPHHDYLMHTMKMADVQPEQFKGMDIFIDGLNGMGPQDILPLMDILGINISGSINLETGQPWPCERPDPMIPRNHGRVTTHMQNRAFDLGLMGDGDFDRIFLFSPDGEMLGGDFLTAMLAENYQGTQALVSTDIRSRLASKKIIRSFGLEPVDTRIGYSHIKHAIQDYNGLGRNLPFGGEVSGHFYFRDEGGIILENTLLAILQALKIIRNRPDRLEQMIAYQQEAFHSGEMLFRFHDNSEAMPALKELKDVFGNNADVITKDRRGVDLEAILIRQQYQEFLEGKATDFLNTIVRTSGSEEHIVKSTIETDSREKLKRYTETLKSILEKHTGRLIECARI